MRLHHALLLAGLAACTGKVEDTEALITGSLETMDSNAEIAGRTAYGFHLDGKGLWYVSTVADASCDDVIDYFEHTDSSDRFEPERVIYGGYCNLTLVSDYDGAEFTLTEADPVTTGYWSLYCPMGTGEWTWEDRHGHQDYYWSGPVWTGQPTGHTTTISGPGEGGGYTIEVDMVDFEGEYGDVIDTIPATGGVTGSIDVVYCPDLYHTEVFPKN
ncbi:MAG: hypothetical protein H6739_05955 [Alphaproteobacteria bacterium]|nr:hypothetical protein [Alphaproteobacteria bacterium]